MPRWMHLREKGGRVHEKTGENQSQTHAPAHAAEQAFAVLARAAAKNGALGCAMQAPRAPVALS